MKASSDRHLGPKLQFLIFALWTVFLVFTVRLFYLQILQGGYYHTLSENNYYAFHGPQESAGQAPGQEREDRLP